MSDLSFLGGQLAGTLGHGDDLPEVRALVDLIRVGADPWEIVQQTERARAAIAMAMADLEES